MNEAELLLTDILGCSRTELCLQKRKQLGPDLGMRMAGVLQRRFKGEPFQYIMGNTEFMGMLFAVTPQVLIPRPETELLVEKVIMLFRESGLKRIIDVGTGSGCIAISLAKMLPDARVTGTDISASALAVAEENAARHRVSVRFARADLFLPEQAARFDCVVSNPPYIAAADIDVLQPEVRREPRHALDGGKDGLDFYRRIIAQAPDHLTRGGYLVMEMGYGQSDAIKTIFMHAGKYTVQEVINDYAGIERVIVARLM